MKTTRKMMNSIFINGLVLLLILQAISIEAQELEDESEYDYDENSKKGPSRWGYLNPEWAACRDGKMQSPIDLSQYLVQIVPETGEIITQYKPSNTTLKNRGHDISLQWTDGGSIQINGIDYTLQQAHWHTPSEHTINGERYDLERHMVHSNEVTGKVAVIGVLYEFGKADPFLSKLTTNLSYMVDTNVNETNPGVIDPNESNNSDEYFYRYEGSLTTPPCNESVIWTVQQKIRTVSRNQVGLLKEAVHDFAEENARPLQPLNGREVNLYAYCPREKIDRSIISSRPAYTEKNRFVGVE